MMKLGNAKREKKQRLGKQNIIKEGTKMERVGEGKEHKTLCLKLEMPCLTQKCSHISFHQYLTLIFTKR